MPETFRRYEVCVAWDDWSEEAEEALTEFFIEIQRPGMGGVYCVSAGPDVSPEDA